MRSSWPLCLVALAGCDLVLGLQEPAPDASASDDAGLDGPALPVTSCETPIVTDRFDQGMPCAPWGSSSEDVGAAITTTAGELVISAIEAEGSAAACTAAPPPAGALAVGIEVSQPLQVAGTFVLLKVFYASPVLSANLVLSNGRLQLRNPDDQTVAEVAFSPDKMRWWRLRTNPSHSGMIGEYSQDAISWQPVGSTQAGVVTSFDRVVIGAGAYDPQPVAREARFGQIDFCAEAPAI